MPAKVSYPGVYIEEIPNGNHAITGVATSITAFVGRARRGPIDSCHESPARIGSFAEYERVFGGLWIESPMSFAVYHFFLNGGSDALIVRVHNSAVAGTASVALADGGTTTFSAANPGMWATRLRMRIDTNINAAVQRANPADTMFNLRVKDLETGITEMHDNLSITQGHPRFVGDVLTQCSMMLRGPATTLSGLPTVNATTSAVDPFDDASATSVAMNADDGTAIEASHIADPRLRDAHRGMFALERAGMFNLLCIPPFAPATDVDKTTWDASVAYATERRALVLVDPPFNTAGWKQPSDVIAAAAITNVAERSANAALFFPRVRVANPLTQNRVEPFAPSALVAGVIARTDALRGVWASPSGTTATLNGVLDLDVSVTDRDNSAINQLGVNCLRHFPQSGPVVWGARTLKGADSLASEWKYLAVRRTALFLQESLYQGTRWVVFEPNEEPLWAQIRLAINLFMQNLFRQGAFQGSAPREAYFVKCDRETMTPSDIDGGIVNIVVGFAPLKPAEFVVITLQQTARSVRA